MKGIQGLEQAEPWRHSQVSIEGKSVVVFMIDLPHFFSLKALYKEQERNRDLSSFEESECKSYVESNVRR
jgi:hypothetical protein